MKLRSGLSAVFALCAITFGFFTVQEPAQASEGQCCSSGSECPGRDICCDPNDIGALDCSSGQPGYCRESCK